MVFVGTTAGILYVQNIKERSLWSRVEIGNGSHPGCAGRSGLFITEARTDERPSEWIDPVMDFEHSLDVSTNF